ncbi:hypothetical protein CUMW_166830 [Citrus unshiu]|uniref:Uncharacterized protein n=1 Tax=Citrus unshiu TaxID=55188 RepID=A0A2H5PTX1_CITUN|nr:hypothetical protein CUMW_166830 [Citrus unshiu]
MRFNLKNKNRMIGTVAAISLTHKSLTAASRTTISLSQPLTVTPTAQCRDGLIPHAQSATISLSSLTVSLSPSVAASTHHSRVWRRCSALSSPAVASYLIHLASHCSLCPSLLSGRLYPSPPPILQWNFPFLANASNTKRSKFAVNVALLSRLKTKLHRQLYNWT